MLANKHTPQFHQPFGLVLAGHRQDKSEFTLSKS